MVMMTVVLVMEVGHGGAGGGSGGVVDVGSGGVGGGDCVIAGVLVSDLSRAVCSEIGKAKSRLPAFTTDGGTCESVLLLSGPFIQAAR